MVVSCSVWPNVDARRLVAGPHICRRRLVEKWRMGFERVLWGSNWGGIMWKEKKCRRGCCPRRWWWWPVVGNHPWTREWSTRVLMHQPKRCATCPVYILYIDETV